MSDHTAMAEVLGAFAESADEREPWHGLALIRCTEGRVYVGQVESVHRDGRTFVFFPVDRVGNFADYPLHLPTETVLLARFANLDEAHRDFTQAPAPG